MKAKTEAQVSLHPFLISLLDGAEWRASCYGHLVPGLRDPCTQWEGD